jgi:hypothetical protein
VDEWENNSLDKCNGLQTRSHGLANKDAFEPTIRLFRTFGGGDPKGLAISAVMPRSHFLGYHPGYFFNSIHWPEEASPRVRKSHNALTWFVPRSSMAVSSQLPSTSVA